MSHANEPWKVVNRGDEECSDIDAKGPEGWGSDVTLAMNISNANARRIVACVNACAGISTEALEGSVGWVLPLWEEGHKAFRQRDELLAALNPDAAERIATEAFLSAKNGDHINDLYKLPERTKLRAAIAAVRGAA